MSDISDYNNDSGLDSRANGSDIPDMGPEELHLSESMSAWLDGEDELSDDQLERLLSDENLRSRWEYYHQIRHCLREHWSSRSPMHQPMQPVARRTWVARHFLPPATTASRRGYLQQAAVFVCAFLLAGAFWQFRQMNDSGEREATPIASHADHSSDIIVISKAGIPVAGDLSAADANKRPDGRGEALAHPDLQTYLVHHSAYLSHMGVQGKVPHARLISFTKED